MTIDAEIATLQTAFNRAEDIPLTTQPISIREPTERLQRLPGREVRSL
ncbi:hypothetical protein RHIZ_22010 [Rhizobium skierniewicense]|nr:hypothetical protein [Rhizobium skierniewicense]MCI9868637.1 hypothetical protein [Rhizobium skierniewicense]